MPKLTDAQRAALKHAARLELARRDFFSFCNLLAPDFYRPDRPHLVRMCREFQDFYESDDLVLIVNVGPRHGKSRTAGMFAPWVLGRDRSKKIMTGSYNEMLSTTFSKNVRNTIQQEKADEGVFVYSDIFPDVRIQRGDGAMNLWSLEGGYNNYLATSPGGTATGFGCNVLIVDDLIKNVEEAFNELTLDKQWQWFTDTMLSRWEMERGGKCIIIMTRWATGDLSGRMERFCKEHDIPYRALIMKTLQDDGTMLCPDILSRESYDIKIKATSPEIASANYQQEPVDIKGTLYKNLKTYDHIPVDATGRPLFSEIKSYTDTADEGADYLCSIAYGVYNSEAYILDVLYTKEGMEVTEGLTAQLFHVNDVRDASIESNNGGRGFARNVERLLREHYRSNRTVVSWFHQSANKKARILANSAWVMDHVYFPANWNDRWPDFHKAITTYQKEGKNKNDDAPDALTGVAESISGKSTARGIRGRPTGW